MKLGARIFKTGLVVVLSFYISSLAGLNSPMFAAIASVLAIQPSVHRSLNYLKEQIRSNIVGALFAILCILYLGKSPIFIGLVIIVVILVNIKLNATSSISLSIVTVIAIMGSTQPDSITYALFRFFSILIGIITALVVNMFFAPPHYEETLLEHIKNSHIRLSFLLRNFLSDSLEEKVYREEKKVVEEEMGKTEEVHELFQEEYANLFKKIRYSHLKKLVVCKHLIQLIQIEFHTLACLEKAYVDLSSSPELKQSFQTQLERLIAYQEQLLFKYEKEMKKLPFEDLMEYNHDLMNSLMNICSNNETKEPWHFHLFPVVSSFIEWSNTLEHANRLIDSLHSPHSQK